MKALLQGWRCQGAKRRGAENLEAMPSSLGRARTYAKNKLPLRNTGFGSTWAKKIFNKKRKCLKQPDRAFDRRLRKAFCNQVLSSVDDSSVLQLERVLRQLRYLGSLIWEGIGEPIH